MAQPSMYQESLRAFLKPILKYLDDDACSEIMINGPTEIWIESKGKVTLTDAKFSEEGLLGAARNMAQFVGRILNDERPRLDARLPDGSRIHVVLPPIARKGTTISIRKFMQGRPGVDKLIEWGSMTAQMAWLIRAMVHTKLNIIVSGGTGSGKTTLLNIVSTQIPNDERILTIEDSAELMLQQDHIVPFESRPADKFGKGEVNMGHLLHSALRLRPDRIVVGEVRGGEAFDLMQAMNTGHGGSMATTHANTPVDTLRRLESLCLMSSVEMPMVAIRAQVASAINGVICCERFHDGSRRTTAIAEVLPLNEKGEYQATPLFVYLPTHKDENGKIHGYHSPTGMLPTFIGRMQAHGFPDIDEKFFDPATYGLPPPPNIFAKDMKTYWAPSLKNREVGEPDSPEVKKMMAAAQEFAEKQEKGHKEDVKAGPSVFLGGYNFGSGSGGHDAPPVRTGAAAPAKPAEPAKPAPAAAAPKPAASAANPRAEPGVEIETRPTQAPRQPAPGFSETTRPPQRPPMAAQPRTTGSVQRALPPKQESKVQVSGEYEVEEEPQRPAPAPRAGLPPGRRPLPPGRRPLPVPAEEEAPEEEEAAAEEEEYEEEQEEGEEGQEAAPNTSEKTQLRDMPPRFKGR
ncbi:MAG TPA: CpaF family protein [Myxococcales bacterium]